MRSVIRSLIILVFVGLFPVLGNAQQFSSCQYTGETCIDSSPCRLFNGQQVCLDQVGRSCWTYNKTYNCIEGVNIDFCTALEDTAGCWQSGATCVAQAYDGSCETTQRVYTCQDPSLPIPPNTQQLGDTYTVTSSLDTSACSSYDQNPLCTQVSNDCTQAGATEVINGDPVYENCWQYTNTYSCIDPNQQNDCTQYANNPTCKETSETCLDTSPSIGCTMDQFTYSCQTNAGQTTTTQDCSASSFCDSNGNCWDTGSPSDTGFAQAVGGLETGREAGVYGGDPLDLFKGVAESCRKGYGGLQNCCGSSGGGQNNNQFMTQIGMNAAQFGSKYMFDELYENVDWIQAGMNAMGTDGISVLTNGASFSMYGLGWTSAAGGAVDGGGLLGGNIALADGFYFNPYALAAAIAIQVITNLMSCSSGEQELSMQKGQNLCYFVGSYCSKKGLGICLQTVQSYCCYNSLLAEIIATQGKPQIGMSFGTAQSPDCDGFTPTEFSQIDWSKIDLSGFIGSIDSATTLPSSSQIQQMMTTEMQNVTTNPSSVITPVNTGNTNPLTP